MNKKLKAAIIFIQPEENGGSLMLEPVVFTPPAVWCAQSLRYVGVDRFLVICRPEELEASRGCFPADAQFITTDVDSEQARGSLMDFLAECGDTNAVVVTKPLFFFREEAERLVKWDGHDDETIHHDAGSAEHQLYCISCEKMRAAMESEAEFTAALAQSGWDVDRVGTALSREGYGWAAAHCAGVDMVNRYWLSHGVLIMDPEHTFIAPTVEPENGVTILPATILRGNTKIGKNCEIGPNAMLTDTVVGENTTVNASQCNQCTIGSHTTVGPFAYIRPDTHVGDHVKVGDFVELKNSTVDHGTKISHLTYVGDSDVGKGVNFGCGTVTVNYDGAKKFRTTIEDDAFIGCNTNLVAPVRVGKGAYIAAGSTITQEVPPDGLAIARARQTVKKQWAAKRRNKQN